MRPSRNLWIGLLLLLPIVGCRGCNETDQASSDDKDATKKKQRIVADELRALPFATEIVGNAIKPGHWYQTRHKLKANFGDESLTASLTIVDKNNVPIQTPEGFPDVNYQRNVALAKGQEKVIESRVLHPTVPPIRVEDPFAQSKSTSLFTRYSMRGIGTPVLEEAFPNKFLEGYQYSIVVLARNLPRFTFWRGLDCIVWPKSNDLESERIVPHRIIDIDESELPTHLPNQLATMTSVSHVVINDVSLSGLSQEQLLALQDWLRFGGTIIINGPEAIAGVETSFLKDLAPLRETSDSEWTAEDDDRLNQDWTIRIAEGDRVPFSSDRKIPKLQGKLAEASQWVPTLEGFVAERLVGQGRIVMTTFPMSDAAFVRWPSYSSLIHNGVLRKHHLEPSLGAEAVQRFAPPLTGSERNPHHNTRLRIWARDFDLSTALAENTARTQERSLQLAEFPSNKSTSYGAWNPASIILEYASLTLRESSGIKVPKVSTILKLLLGYLLILVPINWAVFRLFHRVELAWLAAPIIALTGAIVVASSVQLDIGFSRSQTSLGFLELHNEYPRGVYSGYHALYSSLSTNYSAVYKSSDGVVLPIQKSTRRGATKDSDFLDYWIADEDGTGLQKLPVLSNTTGMIQSEEMIDLGGALAWTIDSTNGTFRVAQNSKVKLQDIGIMGITDQGTFMTGWVGSPEPGTTAQGVLTTTPESQRWLEGWDNQALTKKPLEIRLSDGLVWTDAELDDIYLGALLHTVANRYPLQRGEWIALGWFEEPVTALEIAPTTAQKRQKTLALIHIQAASLPADVRPDTRIFPKQTTEDPEEQP